MDDLKALMTELDEFPKKIDVAEKQMEEMREGWQVERIKRDYAFNAAFLTNKAKGGSEAMAKAQASQDVHDKEMLVIMAESAYRKAVTDYHYLDNRFNALRKMANLQATALQKLGTII